MNYIAIDKYTRQLTKNFSSAEYYKGINFKIPECLVNAAQIIRDWAGKPTKITSTYRPLDTFGWHRYGRAIDFSFNKEPIDTILKFKAECLNYINGKQSNLITALRIIGVNGFGIEGGCIHIDYRASNPNNRKDEYGDYCVFEFAQHFDTSTGKWVIDINRAL